MMGWLGGLFGSLELSSWIVVCTKGFSFILAIWIPFLIGIGIGWSWKPKWVTIKTDYLPIRVAKMLESSLPSSPFSSRLSPLKRFSFRTDDDVLLKDHASVSSSEFEERSKSDSDGEQKSDALNHVTEKDLRHLYQLLVGKDGGPAWNHMMDRATPGMSYQAWTRDLKDGPQYRSRTVFEATSPEIVRDFFWDDDFRKQWDDKLVLSNTIDECSTTGTMLVQWIRKFPFFCSDREYIIDRRIWQSGRSFYCVTKGVHCPSLPPRDKPRRVDVYYSSWFIQPVESQRGDGQCTACEVTLFHHEEMGIPWELAKLGVRQGMWSTVKKIEPGLRAYQKARASAAPLSRCAILAQKTTIVLPELLSSIGADDKLSESGVMAPLDKPSGLNLPKLLVIGGAIAIACTLDRGLLTKTFIFGVGRRFANIGKRG